MASPFSFADIRMFYSNSAIFAITMIVNSSYSAFAEILFGVPQGSILGPLLFNIYICDLSLENSDIDIANYADDNTPYACSSDVDSVIFKLQKNTKRIFRWFYNNNLKAHRQISKKRCFEKYCSCDQACQFSAL